MRVALMLAALLIATAASADEFAIKLKAGAGKDLVEGNCASCHSLDYIVMNSPFLDRAKWDATVKKMAGPFGAPIEQSDIPAIVDYLAANYGAK
jgi:mono/diheme cytochrome c family protein